MWGTKEANETSERLRAAKDHDEAMDMTKRWRARETKAQCANTNENEAERTMVVACTSDLSLPEA